MNIKLGIDPAPPGQYPINRVIVDSDLDGVVSGAILRNVYPHAEILQSESTKVQAGKVDDLVDEHTAMADLFYVEGCGLYFDHHESNKPQRDDFPGCWRNIDSAARVVFDYYRDVLDLSRFRDLLVDVDNFDSGKISLDDFLYPNDHLSLAFIINREDIVFNLLLVELLAKIPFGSVYAHHIVQERVRDFEAQREQVFDLIRQNSRSERGVGVVDMSSYQGYMKISGYMLTSQMLDTKAVIVYKPDPLGEGHRIVFYKNGFNREPMDLDLLSVAQSIKGGVAGGHKNACGLTLPASVDIRKVESDIIDSISDQINKY